MNKPVSRTILTVIFLLFGISSLVAQTRYFPAKSLAKDHQSDQFLATWFSSQLKALEEPSLLQMASSPLVESYRFLWLRSFNHPVAIRLDIERDGNSVLTKKITKGAGGYAPGVLIENTAHRLTATQTKDFLAKSNGSEFWSTCEYISSDGGLDGSEWIIEGVKEGKYHVVTRWSPKRGTVYELGLFFLTNLAQMSIPKDERY